MKRVEAIRDYPDRPKKGASEPLFMLCDDGKDYLVKLPKADWPRALVNETVGAELLARLRLPSPTPAIVGVSPQLVAASDTLRRRGIGPGDYFGTERIPNVIDLSDAVARQLHPSMIENRAQASGVIAFDNLIRNTDRNDGNALLAGVKDTPGPRFHLFAIDHGLILTGQAWTAESLRAASPEQVIAPCHPFLASCVWGLGEFDDPCREIEGLGVDAIRTSVLTVPRSWPLTDLEREAIIDFIVARSRLVRGVLNGFRLAPDREGAN